jgi:cell division protein FtsZ
MDPEKGQRAAEETREEIHEATQGADLVFITCGMGGGTGSGASPVVGRVTKEQNILTIAVVTKPFHFEGRQKMQTAEKSLAELEKEVDAMIVIPNDKILTLISKDTSVKAAYAMSDEVLKQAVEGISGLITTSGTYGNTDMADLRAILQNAGTAIIGVGTASGEGAAIEALKKAIASPLSDSSIHGARGVIVNFSGNTELSMWDFQEASKIIHELIDIDAKTKISTTINESSKSDEVKVTVIATGFPNSHKYSAPNNRDEERVERKEMSRNYSANENLKQKERQEDSSGNSTVSSLRSFFGGSKEEEEIDVIKTKHVDTIHKKEEKKEVAKEEKEIEKAPTVRAVTKKEREAEVVETIEDDSDDWGAIPAFMRRK